jgi:hypothetical protein
MSLTSSFRYLVLCTALLVCAGTSFSQGLRLNGGSTTSDAAAAANAQAVLHSDTSQARGRVARGGSAGREKVEKKRLMTSENEKAQSSWLGELVSGVYTSVTTLSYGWAGSEGVTLVYECASEAKDACQSSTETDK